MRKVPETPDKPLAKSEELIAQMLSLGKTREEAYSYSLHGHYDISKLTMNEYNHIRKKAEMLDNKNQHIILRSLYLSGHFGSVMSMNDKRILLKKIAMGEITVQNGELTFVPSIKDRISAIAEDNKMSGHLAVQKQEVSVTMTLNDLIKQIVNEPEQPSK